MRSTAGLFAAIALLAGCGGERSTTETTPDIQAPSAQMNPPAQSAEQQDLAKLRRVTASFHDFETAKRAGWSSPVGACMTNPTGGMGFHFGKDSLIDGSVRVDRPELLLYEPEANGRMRLVAVEYIVPFTAWSSPKPPQLFGRSFRANTEFGIWALHVWAWEYNPSGLYADWNPRVTCDHATSTSVMDHH